MRDLPSGWRRARLAALAEIQGGIQKQPKRAPRSNRFPFLRVANVTAAGLDLRDVHEIELFGDELQRLRLAPGDLLVVEGNGSPSQIDGRTKTSIAQSRFPRSRRAPRNCTRDVRPSESASVRSCSLSSPSPMTSRRTASSCGVRASASNR